MFSQKGLLQLQRHAFATSTTNCFSRPLSTYDGRNKLSTMFTTLTKEQTAEDSAAATSHGLLLKGGFVRQSSSGIYSMLPLGLRTLEKIEAIIDQELKTIGSQKLSLPALLSAENWKKSGRWNASKGEFFRLKDRRETDMLLSPTHEEEITQLVAAELKSSKQLPIRLYQIGRKYRDEFRPRAGLLRGREFVMKDLYTFDASVKDAYASYDLVAKAYQNIFQRIGIPFVVAEADSGNMGGSKSHEYHLISPAGEDTLLTCSSCGYTANEELAVGKLSEENKTNNVTINVHDHPKDHDNAAITQFNFKAFDKEGLSLHNGKATIVTRPGRSINHIKVEKTLRQYLEEQNMMPNDGMLDLIAVNIDNGTIAKEQQFESNHVFIDDSVQSYAISSPSSSSGGQLIMHGPDHFRTASAGDTCASCSDNNNKNALTTVKAIEVGHTFYLGTKYSKTLGCEFLPTDRQKQQKQPAEMGCYGIGISRMVATAAEVCHDERGIVWPGTIAPYRVCIVPTSNNNKDLMHLADTIYDTLEDVTLYHVKNRGIFVNDVVIDDRKQMFGAKMADAELIGYPFIVVLGKNALESGMVEVNQRIQNKPNIKHKVPIDQLGQWLFERQAI